MSPETQPDKTPDANSPLPAELQDILRTAPAQRSHRNRLSAIHWVLICNTIVLAVMALGIFWFIHQLETLPAEPIVEMAPAARAATSPAPASPSFALPTRALGEPLPAAAPAPSATISVARAQKLFSDGKFEDAQEDFRRLLQIAQTTGADPKSIDFLQLRLAQCAQSLDRAGAAKEMYNSLTQSPSPVIRVMANLRLAAMESADTHYLAARMRAYAALSCLDLVESAAPLEAACDWLVAQSLTQAVLGHELPLAAVVDPFDPLEGKSDQPLAKLLAQGADELAKPILGPEILKTSRGELSGWSVRALQCPLQDLLERLSSAGGVDVQLSAVAAPLRQRPVTLFGPCFAPSRLAEIAAGSAGLISLYDGARFALQDPQAGASVQASMALIGQEGISAWRRAFLRHPRDKHLAAGHLAVGALLEKAGDVPGAISEYQLTAGRYSRDAVAPMALLRCAKMRIGLHDFAGARSDLMTLLDTYPDHPAFEEVYLDLGEATLNLGLYDEAVSNFKKLYFSEASVAAKLAASLGAGKAFFRSKKYDDACQWLDRYLAMAKDAPRADLIDAYTMMAQAQSGRQRWDDAAGAYQRVLQLQPAGPQYAQAVLDLAQVQMERQSYASALGYLRGLEKVELTPDQQAQMLISTARVLRLMGLTDESIGVAQRGLNDTGVDNSNNNFNFKFGLNMELAMGYNQSGQPEKAYNVLTDLYPKLQGPQAHAVGVDLANLCMQLGKNDQAQTLAQEVLRNSNDQAIRQRASEILGTSYLHQQQYDKAAVILSTHRGDDQP